MEQIPLPSVTESASVTHLDCCITLEVTVCKTPKKAELKGCCRF